MSRWLFDLGNTRLKAAPLDAGGRIGPVQAFEHDGARFRAGWHDALPARIGSAAVASVVSTPLRTALLEALSARCGRISVARTLPRCDGVTIAYAHPQRLGVDRFLALLGAHARGGGPWLLAGVGTALTVDLLDAGGLHRGGRIAPSPALMRQALHARAPHLPAGGGEYVGFAGDTADALVSGCEGAALALVQASRDSARALLGADPDVLMHGGGAQPLLERIIERARPQVRRLVLNANGDPERFAGFGLPVEADRQGAADLADVLLIALTGWGSEEDRRRAKEAGFHHHLVKPVELKSVSAVLEQLLPVHSAPSLTH